ISAEPSNATRVCITAGDYSRRVGAMPNAKCKMPKTLRFWHSAFGIQAVVLNSLLGGGAAREARDGGHERGRVDRLRQVQLETGLERLLTIFVTRERRQRHGGARRRARAAQ